MNTDFRERIIRKQKTAKKFVVNRDNNQFKKKIVSTDYTKRAKKANHSGKIKSSRGTSYLIKKDSAKNVVKDVNSKAQKNGVEQGNATAELETSKTIGRGIKNSTKATKTVAKTTTKVTKKSKELIQTKASKKEVLTVVKKGSKKGLVNTSKAAKDTVINEIQEFRGDSESQGINEAIQLKDFIDTGISGAKKTKKAANTAKKSSKALTKFGKSSYKYTQRIAEIGIRRVQQVLSKEVAKALIAKLAIPLTLAVLILSIVTAVISTVNIFNFGAGDCDTSANYDNITTKDIESNAKSIYSIIRKEIPESTPQGISGALGAMQFESQLNPNAVNPSSGATGIAQWLGSRLTSLKEFAHKKGKKETDLGVQVEFLLSELNSSYYQSSKKILAMTDVHEACKEWVMKFEGLSQDSSQWYLDQRNSYADHWYATLGTSDPIAEGTISNGADSELNTLTCDLESDGGDIMEIAKSWLGWFHYDQIHPAPDLGTDLKNPNKNGRTDCSGFVWLVLNKAGYKVPANMQWFTGSMASDARGSHQYLKQISETEAKAGDIVIVNQGAGAGSNGHTGILTEKWRGKDTKIIQEGGNGDSVNIEAFGTSFMSLLDGGDVVLARPIKNN